MRDGDVLERHRAHVELREVRTELPEIRLRKHVNVRCGCHFLPPLLCRRAGEDLTSDIDERPTWKASSRFLDPLEIEPIAESAEETGNGMREMAEQAGGGGGAEQMIIASVVNQNRIRIEPCFSS